MTGIDISADQGQTVPGAWEFIVVKLSENLGTPNFRFDTQWADAARTTRGVYHYARPGSTSGIAQANFFADQALAHGFMPGRDIWQLDCEDGLNPGISSGGWRAFINDFMAIATARLGRRGFMYAGWYFLTGHGIADLPYRYMWWLADYGPNDGTDHGFNVPAPVVIHQFTSKPLDQNNIINHAAFYQAAPIPVPPAPPHNPGGPFVAPDLYPPVGIVSLTPFTHPNFGHAAAAVKADGSVFCSPANAYLGGANGKPYFAGRVAAKIYAVTNGYQIEDTAGEKYGPQF